MKIMGSAVEKDTWAQYGAVDRGSMHTQGTGLVTRFWH